MSSSEQLRFITPSYVQEFLRTSAGVNVSLAEAEELVPFIRGQKAALAELEQFDVGSLRPSATFDPREPYGS